MVKGIIMIDKRVTYFVMGVIVTLLLNAIACEERRGTIDDNDRIKTDTILQEPVSLKLISV